MTEYLPIGYRLKLNSRPGEYIVTKVIGRGASTIAYLTDYVNQSGMHSERILKEFYPNHLDISRSDDGALVCAEKDLEKFVQRKARFVEGGDRQNALRQRTRLKNETPPLQEILDANNTKYLEVTPFEGKTLDHIKDFSIFERIKLCLTVAKLISRYHAEGFLCLDIKPENIFVLTNSAGEVVTNMVEFIDFDSVIEKDKIAFGNALSYTSNWAAPEQINPYGYKKISEATDVYAIGELVFWIVFGRHSTSEEHRSFSEYPFEATDAPFAKMLSRRAVQKLLTKLFHHTLRSSVRNRLRQWTR